jgi:hypothetical protein
MLVRVLSGSELAFTPVMVIAATPSVPAMVSAYSNTFFMISPHFQQFGLT